MESSDREKIEKLIADRKRANAYFSEESEVYRRFVKLENAAFSSGALDSKAKELIALGISVVIGCESCMEWHIGQAMRAGADKAQLIEAIEVGIEMGGGPATVSARFAMKALEYHNMSK